MAPFYTSLYIAVIIQQVFDFLQALAQHNERAWVHAHHRDYQRAKDNMHTLVGQLHQHITRFDESLKFQEPKDFLFNVHRDIRFSKDKTPYKIHFGSYFAKGGRCSGEAGYYWHLQPGGSFVAGGIYKMAPYNLTKIRNTLAQDPDEFLSIIHDKALVQTFGTLKGDKLKSSPRGFDKNNPNIELIKHKHFLFVRKIKDGEILSSSLVSDTAAYFKTLAPFKKYIDNLLQA